MNYYNIPDYVDQIEHLYDGMDLHFLEGKTIVISGACGAICSLLIDGLLCCSNLKIKIIALAHRYPEKNGRFSRFESDPRLQIQVCDLTQPVSLSLAADYVIHGASYTDPAGYAAHPIETMLVNFSGTKTMLDLASANHARFMLLSSCEIYGQLMADEIVENQYGFIDPLSPRSCYNQAKLASETLSICYQQAQGVDVVIPRLSRAFGPTTNPNDTKAATQFLKCALTHQTIIIKSQGTQQYSYLYLGDAARAIVFLLRSGKRGEAYNVTSGFSVQLKDFASLLGQKFGVSVKIGATADSFGKNGYSKIDRSVLSIDKIKALGWEPRETIESAIDKTAAVLKFAWQD